jgi:two-component system OmpR family response regulator
MGVRIGSVGRRGHDWMFGAASLPAFGSVLGNGKDPVGKAMTCHDEEMQILLVEDDARLSALVAQRLRREGHEAETAADGIEGLRLAETGRFDLAVLDVMLPGMDGLSVATSLRTRGDRLPILMLTARDTIDDRVRGLRSGADDYLVKPFAFAELLARIEALGRRTAPTTEAVLIQGAVRLDPRARRVTVDGADIELTAKEFDLLRCLMDHAGRVLTRSELKEQVWDFTFDAQTKVVDLYVHYLRRKLGPAGDIIETVRGVGYAVGR